MPPRNDPRNIKAKLKRITGELEEVKDDITTRLKLSDHGGLTLDYIRKRVKDAILNLTAATTKDDPK